MSDDEKAVRARDAVVLMHQQVGAREWAELARSPFWAWFERTFGFTFTDMLARPELSESVKKALSEPHVGDQGLGILLSEYVQSYRIANDAAWRECCHFWLLYTKTIGLWDGLWARDPRVLEAYSANLQLLERDWAQYLGGKAPTSLIPVSAKNK